MNWYFIIVLLIVYTIGHVRGRKRAKWQASQDRHTIRQLRAEAGQASESINDLTFTNRVLVDEVNELVDENKQLVQDLSMLSDTMQSVLIKHERTLAALN